LRSVHEDCSSSVCLQPQEAPESRAQPSCADDGYFGVTIVADCSRWLHSPGLSSWSCYLCITLTLLVAATSSYIMFSRKSGGHLQNILLSRSVPPISIVACLRALRSKDECASIVHFVGVIRCDSLVKFCLLVNVLD